MLEDTRFDAQISALYLAGTNAIEIARRLDLRVPEVIGRIRAQDLKPVGMAERRAALQPAPAPAPAEADAEVRQSAEPVPLRRPQADKAAASARPGNRPSSRPAIVGNTALKQQIDVDYDDEDEDEDERVVRFTGRPKGWLISEARMKEMYARLGRGY
jgi:hypothetical protein